MVDKVGAEGNTNCGDGARGGVEVGVDVGANVDVGDRGGGGAKVGAVVEADVGAGVGAEVSGDDSARVRATVDVVSARGGVEVGADGGAEGGAGDGGGETTVGVGGNPGVDAGGGVDEGRPEPRHRDNVTRRCGRQHRPRGVDPEAWGYRRSGDIRRNKPGREPNRLNRTGKTHSADESETS